MYVTSGSEDKHAERLRRGLIKLGPDFVATLCWWCRGRTQRHFKPCDVCGKGRHYGSSLGLLINSEPAPESVVAQVLVAAGDDQS